MSRALVGYEWTRARKAVAALAPYDPGLVAQLLGMRRHTVAAILAGPMLPGHTFAVRAACLHLVTPSPLLS